MAPERLKSFAGVSALLWADMLVKFAFFTMQNYLTDVWKLTVIHAAGILNIWEGICRILPFFLLFFVDQFLGHFWMLVISSTAHGAGLGLVVLLITPVLANLNGECQECIGHSQKVVFFIGMSLLALGLAGHFVSVKPFLNRQSDEETSNKSYQISGLIALAIISVIGVYGFPYIKSWALRFGVPAVCSVVATLLFLLVGVHIERSNHRGAHSLVCAEFCWPLSPKDPYHFLLMYNRFTGTMNDRHYPGLVFSGMCLEKAAIIRQGDIDEDGQVRNRLELCSVGEVEEVKPFVRKIQVWLTFIVCGIVSSIGNTYFSEQANNMYRRVGHWKVSSPILYTLYALVKFGFGKCASFLMDAQRSLRYRTYGPAIGIGVAMVFSVLCCITAAKIETKRLTVIRDHGLVNKPDENIPMNAAWLIFQFILLAGLDSFLAKSVDEIFNCEDPSVMSNYLYHLVKVVHGIGYMLGVLSVSVVSKVSQIGGRRNWFQHTLSESRLDRYYWVLAALSSVNLVVFIMVSPAAIYHQQKAQEEEITSVESEI